MTSKYDNDEIYYARTVHVQRARAVTRMYILLNQVGPIIFSPPLGQLYLGRSTEKEREKGVLQIAPEDLPGKTEGYLPFVMHVSQFNE